MSDRSDCEHTVKRLTEKKPELNSFQVRPIPMFNILTTFCAFYILKNNINYILKFYQTNNLLTWYYNLNDQIIPELNLTILFFSN